MKAEKQLKHDDGSVSFDSFDGLKGYLSGEIKKEHIPHNESPVNKYVDVAFPGLRGAVSEHKEKAVRSIAPGQVKSISSIPKKGKEWTSPM